MTIAERKAREAYDRDHPWRSLNDVKAADIGMICEVRFSFHGAATEQGWRRYFTTGAGGWFQIDPPSRLRPWGLPMDFRSTGVGLSESRIRSIIARSDQPGRRGRKRYELYWRSDDTRKA